MSARPQPAAASSATAAPNARPTASKSPAPRWRDDRAAVDAVDDDARERPIRSPPPPARDDRAVVVDRRLRPHAADDPDDALLHRRSVRQPTRTGAPRCYRRGVSIDRPVAAPRHGRHPAPTAGPRSASGRRTRQAVFVTGTFDDWAGDRDGARAATATARPAPGRPTSTGVAPGAEYRFTIRTRGRRPVAHRPVRPPGDELGRQRRSSTTRPPSTGATTTFQMPTWDDLVIYEMHVGTFARDGGPARHLRRGPPPAPLPRATSASRPSRSCRRSSSRATSRGATTRPTCSPSSRATAGPDAFKRFIRDAHAHGIAVIVDVVYNHLGPSDLDLWRFDGWARGRRRRDLLLQRRAGRHAVGRDPARTTAAARSARSCATAR